MNKKETAAAAAKELADVRREALKEAFENYLLNPSSLNYSDTTIKMGVYQSAMNVRRMIAEWEDE
jgi:hypothetical protein